MNQFIIYLLFYLPPDLVLCIVHKSSLFEDTGWCLSWAGVSRGTMVDQISLYLQFMDHKHPGWTTNFDDLLHQSKLNSQPRRYRFKVAHCLQSLLALHSKKNFTGSCQKTLKLSYRGKSLKAWIFSNRTIIAVKKNFSFDVDWVNVVSCYLIVEEEWSDVEWFLGLIRSHNDDISS